MGKLRRSIGVAVLVGVGLMGAYAATAPKVSAPRATSGQDFEICRVHPRDSDCIRFKKGCASGVEREAHGASTACRMPGPQSCRGIEKLLEAASKRLSKLPADPAPAASECVHFTLDTPGKSQRSGCLDGKNDSAKLLFNVFMGIEPLCHGERPDDGGAGTE